MLNVDKILAAIDAGSPVADVAAAHGINPGVVYALLREKRPDRKRTRCRTSSVRSKIKGLLSQGGIEPPRVAFLCEVSRQYVYRIEQEMIGRPQPRDPADIKRPKIEAMLREGVDPPCVAKRCGVARSYVHKIKMEL